MPRAARLRVRFNQLLTQAGLSKDWFLIPLAAATGVLGGLVATGFDWLVEASGHFFFGTLGRQTFPLSEYLLLVMLRDLPVFETVIPSKVFEFLAQERPVVLAAKGEIRRLVSEAGAALVIDPERPEALAEAVRRVRTDAEQARTRAQAGRKWVEAGFLRDALARDLARFLARVVDGTP